MKICAISDTHSKHRLIDISLIPADTDLLIHAGDITWTGEYNILADFNAWLEKLSWIEHKVVIAGNHDRSLEKQPGLAQGILTNAIYLCDSMVDIEGLRIYGSAWTPQFGRNWAFMAERGKDIARFWRCLAEGQVKPDILLTHGPPHGILDTVYSGEQAGCEELAKAVAIVKPKLHVFGHIHEGYGRIEKDGTLFVNAATVDEHYRPTNPPQIITL